MTKVKICGLLEEEHVRAAVQGGANAIGFVFAPSSRQVTVERAMELAKYVPEDVWKIGVFVNPSAEEVQRIFQAIPLDYVQYHGEESPAFIREVGLPSIKAFSVQTKGDVERAAAYDVEYFLFDAPGTDYKGGSGQTFDWSLLEDVGIHKQQIILAGGLQANNVVEAIHLVQPAMVDVSSGVECDKRKDASLIREFLQTVQEEEK